MTCLTQSNLVLIETLLERSLVLQDKYNQAVSIEWILFLMFYKHKPITKK